MRTSGNTSVASYALTLNPNGFPIAWTDVDGAHAVVVDGANRILSVDHPASLGPDEAYAYDGNGNRIQSHLDTGLVHSVASGSGSDRLVS